MTSEPISQAEIDALLRGALGAGADRDGAAPQPPSPPPATGHTPPGPADGGWLPGAAGGEDWSGLQTAAAVALEGAWAVAPALLGAPAQVGEVQVVAVTAREAMARFGPEAVWGRVALADGHAFTLLPESLALAMIGLMLGGQTPRELNATGTAALAEALGQLAGKALSRLLSQAGWAATLAPMEVIPAAAAPAADLPPGEAPLAMVYHPVQVGEHAGTMGLAMPLELARRLNLALRGTTAAPVGASPAAVASAPAPATGPRPDAVLPPRPAPPAPAAAVPEWGAPAPQSPSSPGYPAAPAGYAHGTPPLPPGPAVAYQPAQFRDLSPGEANGPQRNIDLLMDVALQVTVELGRTRKQIREVLALGPGSVIELEKLAGEPVDVLVNGKLIARGEVVVIEEHFGVRITDIISPAERAASLGR